jgi:hypothetical protein
MAKNHEKFEYYDVAVPKTNTLLLRYLQETYDNTNTPGSQLLVQLATERVKQLCGDGQPASLSALGPLQAVMASMFSALPQQVGAAPTNGATMVSPLQPSGAVKPLGYDLMQSGAAEEDMDSAFGDPD